MNIFIKSKNIETNFISFFLVPFLCDIHQELGEHLEMVTSLGVNVNQLGWQKFDVTKVVSNWYSGHELSSTKTEKLTLLVDCTGCGSHVHVSTFGVQTPNVVESSINSKGEMTEFFVKNHWQFYFFNSQLMIVPRKRNECRMLFFFNSRRRRP